MESNWRWNAWDIAGGLFEVTLVARRLFPLFPIEYYAWAPRSVTVMGVTYDMIYRLVSRGVDFWTVGGAYPYVAGTVHFPGPFPVAPD